MKTHKGFLTVVAIGALAIGAIAISMYMKQRSGAARAQFAVGGYTIPGSASGTHQLTQATPPIKAGYLYGAAREPDKDIDYTLKNIRTIDNSFVTGAYVGGGGSAGHTEAAHGENSYKNQDMLRNSTLAIPITVPPPITVPKISIAGSEYHGTSYLGGIGSPRAPQHTTVKTGRPYLNFPLQNMQSEGYPNFPISGAYRASSKGFI